MSLSRRPPLRLASVAASVAAMVMIAAAGSLALLGGCTRPASADSSAPVRVVEIRVGAAYAPDRIPAVAGEHLQLRFVRDVEGCTSEVVFPTLDLKRSLPLHASVLIDLGVVKQGPIPFQCGMNMVHGLVVVTDPS